MNTDQGGIVSVYAVQSAVKIFRGLVGARKTLGLVKREAAKALSSEEDGSAKGQTQPSNGLTTDYADHTDQGRAVSVPSVQSAVKIFRGLVGAR